MDVAVKPVAVVQGATGGTDIQGLFSELVARWQPSARIAGVVAEGHGLERRACNAGYLRSIRDGRRFSIFQDLGAGSEACHLDASGATTASAAVCRDIAEGCDLVVLSKFGKLEAAREGLMPAFIAAVEAGVPVLTSVSSKFRSEWDRFADPLITYLPAEASAVETWWQAVRAAKAGQPAA